MIVEYLDPGGTRYYETGTPVGWTPTAIVAHLQNADLTVLCGQYPWVGTYLATPYAKFTYREMPPLTTSFIDIKMLLYRALSMTPSTDC